MKSFKNHVCILLSVFAMGATAHAGDVDLMVDKDLTSAPAPSTDAKTWSMPLNAVIETKTKITCSATYGERVTTTDGTVSEANYSGKISESLRTTWKNDGVEYRISDHASFGENGARQVAKGHTTAKFTQREENGFLIEEFEGQSIYQYLGGVSSKDGNLFQRNSSSSTTYKVDGNKRTTVKSILNGKEIPSGDVETTTQISETQQEIKIWSPAYTETFDWGKIETTDMETTCLLESI